jgi:4-amino-4-deoxy-L-arabinose transferase-like glycosyltransferase
MRSEPANVAAWRPRALLDRAVAAPIWWEATAVLVIVAAAAVFRLQHLSWIPYGISGDEAIFGLEGRRILDEGSIGPYSPFANGQPAGVLYLASISIWALGGTIFAIRLVPAVAGILTVLALYAYGRRHFGVGTGLLGGAVLAVSSWHIAISRFAIPLAAWPLVGLLTVAALCEALRAPRPGATRWSSWRWWVAAGIFAALGVYVYDANNVFLVVLVLFLAGVAIVRRRELRPLLEGVAVMAVAFVVVAAPMIRYIAEHPGDYVGHARSNTIFRQPQWTSLRGVGAKAWFLARRYVEYWDRLCCNPRVDLDGIGLAPTARAPFLALAACGMLLALWRRRGPPVALGITLILLMPIAYVLSEGGQARRAFVTLPFLAIFAAFGAVGLVHEVGRRRRSLRLPVAAALAALFGLLAYQNLDDYFGKLPGSEAERFYFTRPMTDASFYMNRLPGDRHVYFYSAGASFTYEVRRFLAPDVVGEDRSHEFGANYSFDLANDGRVPVFVFMDAYEPDVAIVKRRYPGGQTVIGGKKSNPSFVAYTATQTS